MNIASVSINRPVLASVLSILIVLMGFVSFTFLGLREYPSVDPPVITVTTNYTGANASIIETQITEPLEEQINGISGIRSLTSSSTDGRSTITVEFNIDADLEAASNDVRDRVSRGIRRLPIDCDPPVVVKSDADADAILIIAVQSSSRTILEVNDIATNVIKERIQTIEGVSEIRIFGEKKYSMKLLLDPIKMSAYGITPSDIKLALQKENVELPAGKIEGIETELSIRTLGRLSSEDDFNNLIIKETQNSLIKLNDIGQAQILAENEKTALRGNGAIHQVALAVTPLPGSNHIDIADQCYKRIEQIERELPDDIILTKVIDSTTSIRKAILEVEETIFLAFGLVVLIIFIFLREWKTTLIPIITIPISLIGTFAIMYLSGFTINLLTLLGIVLATGLVVDDAIVVLENIYKKIEHGENPIAAGHKGSKEIYFAIISTTITLVAVFVPIMFLSGLTGRLFREFAVVVAGSVLISAFVSLTLTPMMSARLLKKELHPSKFYIYSGALFDRLTHAYNRSLIRFIHHKKFAFVIIAFAVIITLFIGFFIPSELAPMEDKSRLRIQVTAPEGTAYELMDDYMMKVFRLIDTIPEKEAIIMGTSRQSVNSGFARLSLTQPETREKTQAEISEAINKELKKMNFARSFAVQDQTIASGSKSSLPIQFVIQAPSFDELKEKVPLFLAKANEDKNFQTVDINLKFNKPEIQIAIDRDRARSMGVSIKDIAEAIQLYFSGQRYGYYIYNDKQYQIIGLADPSSRNTPDDLTNIHVRNSSGELIQLSNLIHYSYESNPPQRFRFNRYASATIQAQPADGKTLGQGIEAMQSIAKETLNDKFSTQLTGASRDFAESSSSIFYAFFFTLILIYLILAAQFESYSDPLVVMFTVPLAIAGTMISLFIFNQTLNIFSEIGMIVLIGIVTKNGILIVEFANQRKEHGLSVQEAVIDAATQRLRPILMTSFATILGALPIALALGAASQSRMPMGISIIGGLLFSLLLTLYVIPALYTYLSRKK